MMRLPARMRTRLKHGHGPLEDRVVVLGSLEVDDVLRGIDEVTEQWQRFREPPAIGRLVDPLERFGEERIETRRDSLVGAGRGASLELVAAGVAVDYTEPAWTSNFNARPVLVYFHSAAHSPSIGNISFSLSQGQAFGCPKRQQVISPLKTARSSSSISSWLS